jgi:hypothetical protein
MGWRQPLAVFAGALLMVGLFCGVVVLERVAPSAFASQPLDSDHMYNPTNVWTIHLKFAPDQWEAMEHEGGSNPFFGGARGGRGVVPGVLADAAGVRLRWLPEPRTQGCS